MSRWFRHYAGMMRDDKLVRVSIKSAQSVERVCWVWGAILESAAEVDDEGHYEVDAAEISRFLRCKASAIDSIIAALTDAGRITDGKVAKWQTRQYKSDRSAARVALHRDRKRNGGNDDETLHETLQQRHCNSPETETETETDIPLANANGATFDFVDPAQPATPAAEADPDTAFWTSARTYLGRSKSGMIGRWVKDHGREATAGAIAAAQVERAVDPVAYVNGVFKRNGNGRGRVEDWRPPNPDIPI